MHDDLEDFSLTQEATEKDPKKERIEGGAGELGEVGDHG